MIDIYLSFLKALKIIRRKTMDINQKSQNIKLEKEKNEYFIDWIYKIWHHHDTVDKLYQCNYDANIKFKENEFYYKILKDEQIVRVCWFGLKR